MNRPEQALRCAVLAVDPGTSRSAICDLDAMLMPLDAMLMPRCDRLENGELLILLRDYYFGATSPPVLVIEQVEHYGSGMPIGRDVLETVYWSGRFCEAWESRGGTVERLPRRAVKLHLCGSSRAKDKNIRQALIDRWGGQERAIGRKGTAGPLYRIAGDEWSALAVAVVWLDQRSGGAQPRQAPPLSAGQIAE